MSKKQTKRFEKNVNKGINIQYYNKNCSKFKRVQLNYGRTWESGKGAKRGTFPSKLSISDHFKDQSLQNYVWSTSIMAQSMSVFGMKLVLKHYHKIANNINVYFKGSGMMSHIDVSVPEANDGFDLGAIASLTVQSHGSKWFSLSSNKVMPVLPSNVLSLRRGDLVLFGPPTSTKFYHSVPASKDSPLNVTMQWRAFLGENMSL